MMKGGFAAMGDNREWRWYDHCHKDLGARRIGFEGAKLVLVIMMMMMMRMIMMMMMRRIISGTSQASTTVEASLVDDSRPLATPQILLSVCLCICIFPFVFVFVFTLYPCLCICLYLLPLSIHAKNVWCCGEGYFGPKIIAEKVRKSRQNVNRDKSA